MLSVDEELEKLKDFYGDEELDPELLPYVEELEDFRALRHPLVFFVPYSEHINKQANLMLKTKQELLANAVSDGDAQGYVFIHERPYRLDAFREWVMNNKVKDKDYWELLASIWIDTENYWQNRDTWLEVFGAHRRRQEFFMDRDERREYEVLPDSVTVFRGTSHLESKRGLSWTLDENKALWFAKRFAGDKEPWLVTGKVRKEDVIGLLNGRGESEIVVLPWCVEVIDEKGVWK